MVSAQVDEKVYEEVFEAGARVGGSFEFMREGCPSFIIIRSSDLGLAQDAPGSAEVASVYNDMADFERGDYIDAREFSNRFHERYGL